MLLLIVYASKSLVLTTKHKANFLHLKSVRELIGGRSYLGGLGMAREGRIREQGVRPARKEENRSRIKIFGLKSTRRLLTLQICEK